MSKKKYPNDLWKCSINSIDFKRRSNEICSICQNYILDKNLTITKCSHKFHFNCLDKWQKKNNSCPLCRKNLVDNDVDCLNKELNNQMSNMSINNNGNQNEEPNPYDEYYNHGISINSFPNINRIDYNNPNINDIDDYPLGMNSFVDLNTIRNQY